MAPAAAVACGVSSPALLPALDGLVNLKTLDIRTCTACRPVGLQGMIMQQKLGTTRSTMLQK
jgi:hypothetical protein